MDHDEYFLQGVVEVAVSKPEPLQRRPNEVGVPAVHLIDANRERSRFFAL